jgi:beta-glucosidase
MMPWIDQVSGVLEAWYAGSKGAEAVANILFGDVNPSAKLPMTFPRREADLPHPQLVTPPPEARGIAAVMRTGEAKPTFSVHYDEGLKVGYKWYDAENKPVLFPFGFGLSYAKYEYSDLKITTGKDTTLRFTVKNTGSRAGAETAELYAALPDEAGEPPKRLIGWSKVRLKQGESREIEVFINPKYLSIYDEAQDRWKLMPGRYMFLVGGSSRDLPLHEAVEIK